MLYILFLSRPASQEDIKCAKLRAYCPNMYTVPMKEAVLMFDLQKGILTTLKKWVEKWVHLY